MILKLWQATNRHVFSRTDDLSVWRIFFSRPKRGERIFDVFFFSDFSHASSWMEQITLFSQRCFLLGLGAADFRLLFQKKKKGSRKQAWTPQPKRLFQTQLWLWSFCNSVKGIVYRQGLLPSSNQWLLDTRCNTDFWVKCDPSTSGTGPVCRDLKKWFRSYW